MSATRTRRPSPGRIDLIRLPRTPTSDINVENNNPSIRASLERHELFDDAESFTVLAQRETEAALSRHLQQEEQLARFRSSTRQRLEASCVKYDEIDLKQESLNRRQVRGYLVLSALKQPAFCTQVASPLSGTNGHLAHSSQRHTPSEF
jgi:hypothetical protein